MNQSLVGNAVYLFIFQIIFWFHYNLNYLLVLSSKNLKYFGCHLNQNPIFSILNISKFKIIHNIYYIFVTVFLHLNQFTFILNVLIDAQNLKIKNLITWLSFELSLNHLLITKQYYPMELVIWSDQKFFHFVFVIYPVYTIFYS